ncbi:hypothetical protein MSG28_016160 [Choristoneura fumiferana]|uniref:Uncharacterized protein n=1 Tax=Choristoneura fumiferana TaxID=7141 RepID=A0ACC0K5L4_CHOFU|nr:hypothetical protein MSG28_016160 [Choristoneura fumiferana]
MALSIGGQFCQCLVGYAVVRLTIMEQQIEEIYVKPDITQLKVEVNLNPYQPPEEVFGLKIEENPAPINEATDLLEPPNTEPVEIVEDDIVDCNKCYRTFKSVGHLRSHLHSVHAEEKEVNCNHCGKVFINKKRLSNHIFYSHPEPEETVNCSVCSKSFKRRYNLKIHMRLVHPSEGSSVQCPHCDKKFKVDMLLQRHIKWSHPQDGMMYRCPECGRTLPSIACFKKHMQNVHSGNQDAICKVCCKVFKTMKTLRRHEKNVHGGQKVESKPSKVGDLQCSQCEKKFTTNTALFWHFERYHSENKRSTACQICKKELSDHGSLKRHLDMVHSLESARCHICSKTFKSHMNLQRHIRVTHAPPEAAQTCDTCNKTFKCSMHLRIHINAVHSKEGIFTCDICNKEFASKKYMLKHKKTHVDVKEFPCEICKKLFKCVNDVKKHAKRVHMKNLKKEEKLESGREESLNCLKCGSVFNNEEELHGHILKCGGMHAINFVKVEIEDVDAND